MTTTTTTSSATTSTSRTGGPGAADPAGTSSSEPVPGAPLDVRVADRRQVADGILELTFAPATPDAAPLPPFTPGAHVDVHLPGGLTRQYSLCGEVDDPVGYRIAVQVEADGRGGSRAVAAHLVEGARLTIGAPRNRFPLDEEASFSLLLAGGIGLTPVLAMARRLARLGRPFRLHYAARSEDKLAFRAELDALARAPGAEVFTHVDGRPDALDLQQAIGARPEGGQLYVCGPAGFMDAVVDRAQGAGWPEQAIHLESFTARVRADDEAFTVVLSRSDRRVDVPAGTTIAEALEDIGIEVPLSCEAGMCGTCVTRVLEGVPDHRDHILTAEEKAGNDLMTVCCSRARTPLLVLDL